MRSPILFFAEIIYRRTKPSAGRKKNPQICRALSQLYSSENMEKAYERFQTKRLASLLSVVMIGVMSAVLFPLCSRGEERLADGGRLIRNEWGAGDYRVKLQVQTKAWSREIPYLVQERELSEEERDELFEELSVILPDLIKGNNLDLSAVTGDLNLTSSVEGYPFRLAWSSENGEIVDRSGRVNRTGIGGEGERVRLSVKISYGESSVNYSYDVFLLPEELSEEERFFRGLEKELRDREQEQRSEKELTLPERLQGEALSWEETDGAVGQTRWLLLLLTLLCGVLVCKGAENDLKQKCKRRSRELLADYPEFVSKLRLYLSAGLTVKNALFRMSSDYFGQQAKGKEHYLYKEIKLACHQLQNGMSEEQVYQDFGRRCGQMRYRRLSFLLSVHLKQGNQQLLMLLSQEADSAQEDRMSMARKAGEEAGTKLLLPMMLMMVVAMILVLLPAYINFGSI